MLWRCLNHTPSMFWWVAIKKNSWFYSTISCTIERSWYSQDSDSLNPHWLGDNKLFSWKWSNVELKIMLFPSTGKRETRLYLSVIYLPAFLWTVTTFNLYQLSGKLSISIQFWNIRNCGAMIDWSFSFIALIDASSCPWALLITRLLRIFNIFSLVKLISESLASESYSRKLGGALIFLFVVVHFEEKNDVEGICLFQKSCSSLLYIIRSGINGNLFLL